MPWDVCPVTAREDQTVEPYVFRLSNNSSADEREAIEKAFACLRRDLKGGSADIPDEIGKIQTTHEVVLPEVTFVPGQERRARDYILSGRRIIFWVFAGHLRCPHCQVPPNDKYLIQRKVIGSEEVFIVVYSLCYCLSIRHPGNLGRGLA